MSRKLVVVFVHGLTGFGKNVFFRPLQREFEAQGIEFYAPDLPKADNPIYSDWSVPLLEILNSISDDKDIIFICHSMGGYTCLRLIGENIDKKWADHIKSVVLVASAASKRPEYKPMYDKDINFENICTKTQMSIHSFWSMDDERVKIEQTNLLREKLQNFPNFVYHELNGYNHFITKEVPEVFELVHSLVKEYLY